MKHVAVRIQTWILGGLTLSWGLFACNDGETTPPQADASSQPAISASTPTATTSETAPASDQPSIVPSGSIPIKAGATNVYGQPSDVDFGIVAPGSKMKTSMTLVNPTATPMRILKAAPTCQCTTVEIEGLTIPPRGGIRFPLTLQVPNTTGLKQAAVNTALQPVTADARPVQGPRLTLTAVAAYAVRTTPVFVDALTPAGMVGEITLTSDDQVPFTVLSVNGEPPRMDTPNAPATSQVVGYDLRDKTPTTMPKWLFIETDHPSAPLLEMRIRHEWAKLPHQLRPVNVVFDGYLANVGAITAGTPIPFTIELKQFENRRVVNLDSGDPSFPVTLLRQVDGDSDRVRVDAVVTAAPGTTGPFVVPISCRTQRGSETMYLIGTVR